MGFRVVGGRNRAGAARTQLAPRHISSASLIRAQESNDVHALGGRGEDSDIFASNCL